MEVNSEELFTEVEVNRPGYSPGEYTGFSSTLRWIITLAYTKPVNQCSKKITIFVFLCRILKFVNILGSWQLFRVSVAISAFLVKLKRRMVFKNKTSPYKITKPIFVAFFLLIGMAFSFISEIWASLKLFGNRDAMEYPRIFLDREPIKVRKNTSLVWYMLMGSILPRGITVLVQTQQVNILSKIIYFSSE